jgi:hypothetical protein
MVSDRAASVHLLPKGIAQSSTNKPIANKSIANGDISETQNCEARAAAWERD